MKKLLVLFTIITSTSVLSACSGNNTDSGAMNEILEIDTSVDENNNKNWDHENQETWEMIAGNSQSPINIVTGDAVPKSDEGSIQLNYIDSDYEQVVDTGHDILVNKRGVAVINGRNFELLQYHFHVESEHTLDGVRFPMELHFVHRSEAGKLAVIGVFFEEGNENPALDEILNNVQTGTTVDLEQGINIDSLLPENKTYFHYLGSLTTPPLTENVEWYIMKNTVQASKEQLENFKQFHDNNYREAQPLNDRNVLIKIAE